MFRTVQSLKIAANVALSSACTWTVMLEFPEYKDCRTIPLCDFASIDVQVITDTRAVADASRTSSYLLTERVTMFSI